MQIELEVIKFDDVEEVIFNELTSDSAIIFGNLNHIKFTHDSDNK